ncbi:MAG: hypothetical protein ACRDVL_08775, partial [Acidimicrobiia bacterium]
QLVTSMQTTAETAQSMLNEMLGFVDEYLEEGGPLWMLEHAMSEPDSERLEFHGRPMYPERLHVVVLAIDVTTQLLESIHSFFNDAADRVASWPSTIDISITPDTRQRLERIQTRANAPSRNGPTQRPTRV